MRGRVAKPWMRPTGVTGFLRSLAIGMCTPLLLASCRTPRDHSTSAAIGLLRSVHAALKDYKATCGGFPSTLSALASPRNGAEKSCQALGNLSDGTMQQLTAAPQATDQYVWDYSASEPMDSAPALHRRYVLRGHWEGSAQDIHQALWTSERGTIRIARGKQAMPTDAVLE